MAFYKKRSKALDLMGEKSIRYVSKSLSEEVIDSIKKYEVWYRKLIKDYLCTYADYFEKLGCKIYVQIDRSRRMPFFCKDTGCCRHIISAVSNRLRHICASLLHVVEFCHNFCNFFVHSMRLMHENKL